MRAECPVCLTPIPVGDEYDDPYMVDVVAHAMNHERQEMK